MSDINEWLFQLNGNQFIFSFIFIIEKFDENNDPKI